MIIKTLKQYFRPSLEKWIPFFLFFAITSAYGQQYKTYNLVKDFGARPDNKTNAYNAFLNAAATISKAGGGTLIIPKGNYYIASYKIIVGTNKNMITDILFSHCRVLKIEGNGSVIRVNGQFTRTADYQLPGLPHKYSSENTVCPIKISDCSNVIVRNLTLYGEVDKMKKETGVVEGENYGISINDETEKDISSNILLENITVRYFAADGILVSANGENITINNCKAVNNARQGLSIVRGRNIKCFSSTFDSTGVTGAYGWHMPGAGIDVENEFGKGTLRNVLIRNCKLRGNNGFQIVTTIPSENIIIDSCFISDKTSGYSDGLNGVGLYSLGSSLTNSIIFGTIQVDIADQYYKGDLVQTFSNNVIYSGGQGILSADFSRPCVVNNNVFIMLPKPKNDTYFPYIQNRNCTFNNNVIFVHSDRIKGAESPLVSLVQNVNETSNNFWLTNKAVSEKKYFFPSFGEPQKIGKQFFPVNDKIAWLNFPPKRMLPAGEIAKLTKSPIIAQYRQTMFDKSILVKAAEIRKTAAAIAAAQRD